MIEPREKRSAQEHIIALSNCRDGKPTEGVLMRFNEQEFYLLNLAARLSSSRGYASRQAWMRSVVLNAIRSEIDSAEEMQELVNAFFK